MSFYYFDKRRWPIVILTIENTPTSVEDMNEFLSSWQELYTDSMLTNKKYKLLFDTRKSGQVAIIYLRMLANWLIKVQELTINWMDKTAIIVSRPLIKTLIQLVFTIYKAVRPFRIFHGEELEEAIIWLESNDIKTEDTSKWQESISLKTLSESPEINFS